MKLWPRFLAILAWLSLTLVHGAPASAAGTWSAMVVDKDSRTFVVGTAADRLMAFGPDGRILWRIKRAGATSLRMVLSGDRVVLVDKDAGQVAIVRRDTGARIWFYDAGSPLLTTPILANHRWMVAAGAKEGSRLVALDEATGSEAWQIAAPAVGGKIAALSEVAPGLLEVAVEQAGPQVVVRGIDATNGRLHWTSEPFPGTIKSLSDGLVVTTAAAPATADRYAAVDSTDGHVGWQREIDLGAYEEPQRLGGWIVARKMNGPLQAWSARTGAPVWEREPGLPSGLHGVEVSIGPLGSGVLYVLSKVPPQGTGGQKSPPRVLLLALDAATGRETGRLMANTRADGSPSLVGDQVLLPVTVAKGATDATEHALWALKPRTLERAWSARLQDGLGDSSPLMTSSLLIAQDGSRIVALDAATGSERWTQLTDGVSAGPAVLGDTLVFGDDQQALRALRVESGQRQWSLSTKLMFAEKKTWNLVGVALITLFISWFIFHARRGQRMYVRRINGLSALDEAVGRATEMGKPVLYVTGLADVDDIQTLASLSILGHVARRTAEYETPILVPCARSVVMSMAQEVVKEAHFKAGRPDSYHRENVRYLTDDQFGFVAGVDGIMMRDKPAANFYMGMFFAESLILAETGHATGAIQIAGTAAASQLPFFVAACDYTLMGEELFAAGAYLSGDPLQLGSLKGQDAAKALVMGVIFVFCLLVPHYAWLAKVLTP